MASTRNTVFAQGTRLKIQILEEISGWFWFGVGAKKLSEILEDHPDATHIDVEINSPGGDVFEAFAMMSLLRDHSARVVTTNLGSALSAAAILMFAGDERRAAPQSYMLLHSAWSMMIGDQKALETQAELLGKINADQAELVASRSKLDVDELRADLANGNELWFNAKEQLDAGLVDAILTTGAPAALAMLPPGRFQNTPAALLAQHGDGDSMPKPPPEIEIEKARQDERSRIQAIHRAGSALGVEQAAVDKAVADGVSVEAFNAQAIDAFAESRPPYVNDAGRAPITAGGDARDKQTAAVEDWLLAKAGLAARVRQAQALRPDIEALQRPVGNGGPFRGASLIDLCRKALGAGSEGLTKSEIVARFFRVAASGGGNTTADFPVAFENVMHKVLLASFANTPSTWRRFVRVGAPVPDFREQLRYRQGFLSSLSDLNEGGEIRRKPLPDAAKESLRLKTRGNIVSITREAIINDDMAFLSSTAAELGQAAERTLEILVYTLLAQNGGLGPVMSDGKTLFHGDHLNIGTGSALAIDSLAADVLQFKQQRDINDEDFLDIRPSRLLVSTALSFLAKQINEEANDFTSGREVASMNVMRGAFADVIDSPRLTGTRRYLFADPNMLPVLEMIFLEGFGDSPVLESMTQWNTLGRDWRVYQDAAVGAVAWEGALTNAGA